MTLIKLFILLLHFILFHDAISRTVKQCAVSVSLRCASEEVKTYKVFAQEHTHDNCTEAVKTNGSASSDWVGASKL